MTLAVETLILDWLRMRVKASGHTITGSSIIISLGADMLIAGLLAKNLERSASVH